MTSKSVTSVRDKGADDQSWIEQFLRERWGSSLIVVHGISYDATALPALVAGQRDGLATYRIDRDRAQLITLDARTPGQGTGTSLLDALRQRLDVAGVRELDVTTTNDNLRALRFYQRRGFRLSALHCGAIDQARRLKPSIPSLGQDGIPIRDELDLCLRLR